MPASGTIVACGDSDELRELVATARAPIVLYGERAENAVRLLRRPGRRAGGHRAFDCASESGEEIEVDFSLWGVHNATNALAVWAAARRDGIDGAGAPRALGGFHGVAAARRRSPPGGGVTVIDDFAHHPTAVEKTLASLRMRFPGRRLVACFEPRSLTAGRAFFYSTAIDAPSARADIVLLAPIFHRDRLAPDERLDLAALVDELRGRESRPKRCRRSTRLADGRSRVRAPATCS